jgi:hypothetical protein
MAITHFRYSFKRGFNNLTISEAQSVKTEIYKLLGCTARSVYSRKKKSYRDIPHQIYQDITDIFQRHGVSPDEVWDKEEIKDE